MGRGRARLLLVGLGTSLAFLAGASTASAASIVYIQDSNVWLMNPDGSGKYQVTLDGTSESPYLSPSQADDGTIAAVHATSSVGSERDELVRMRQNGTVLSSVVPEVVFDHGIDQADISPDGSKVAYRTSYNGNSDCSSPGFQEFCYFLRVTDADSPTDLGGIEFHENPSWISNTRLLANNSFQRIVTYDVGASGANEWFGRDIPDLSEESIYDPDMRGNHVAAYKTNPYPAELRIYRTNGDPPALPTYQCSYTNPPGGAFNDPSFSPDGSALAWEAGDDDPFTPPSGTQGIFVTPSITDAACADASLVAAGGQEPDFGPADVNPGERGGGGGGGGEDDGEPPDAAVGFVKTKLGKALKRGFFKANVETSEPGVVAMEARARGKVVARGSRGLPDAGTYSVKLKFTKKARKKYRRAGKLKMKVEVAVADVFRNAVAGTFNVTLRR